MLSLAQLAPAIGLIDIDLRLRGAPLGLGVGNFPAAFVDALKLHVDDPQISLRPQNLQFGVVGLNPRRIDGGLPLGDAGTKLALIGNRPLEGGALRSSRLLELADLSLEPEQMRRRLVLGTTHHGTVAKQGLPVEGHQLSLETVAVKTCRSLQVVDHQDVEHEVAHPGVVGLRIAQQTQQRRDDRPAPWGIGERHAERSSASAAGRSPGPSLHARGSRLRAAPNPCRRPAGTRARHRARHPTRGRAPAHTPGDRPPGRPAPTGTASPSGARVPRQHGLCAGTHTLEALVDFVDGPQPRAGHGERLAERVDFGIRAVQRVLACPKAMLRFRFGAPQFPTCHCAIRASGPRALRVAA